MLVRYISKRKHTGGWAPSVSRRRRWFYSASSCASFCPMAGDKVVIEEQFLALLKPPTRDPNSTPSGIQSQSDAHRLCPRLEKREDICRIELGHCQMEWATDGYCWAKLSYKISPPPLISPFSICTHYLCPGLASKGGCGWGTDWPKEVNLP